jgi:hypothetical protein
MAHYNGSNQWDTYGGIFNTGSGFAAGSITWAGVNNFTAFSLGSTDASNPLPVKLDYFNGHKQGGNNYLNWKVTCTANADTKMTMERSADGRNFTALTSVTADAVRCLQAFDYVDAHPLSGTNYYRLKIIAVNGVITYSSTIVLLNSASDFDIVGLMPSVINTTATLNVIAAKKSIINIVITDAAGRRVQQLTSDLIPGKNYISIDLSRLSAGSYQLTAYTKDLVTKTIRFVKQ